MRPFILYADETNSEPGEAVEFFLYGGIWLPTDRLADLDTALANIRRVAGYRAGDTFKFDTRSRPRYVDAGAHTRAKRAVLDACTELEVRFAAATVLHEIAKRPDWRWSLQADAVLLAFNEFLTEEDGIGLVVLDRRYGIFDYIEEKFQFGSINKVTSGATRLGRIHLYSAGSAKSSNVASVSDVVLGSLRYCVNDREAGAATSQMLPAVVKLMWSLRRSDGSVTVRNRGLLLRPQIVKVARHAERYRELRERFEEVIRRAETA